MKFFWQRTSCSDERTDSITTTCYQIWRRFSETFCKISTPNGYLFLLLQFALKLEPILVSFRGSKSSKLTLYTFERSFPIQTLTELKRMVNHTLNTWGQIAVVIGSELIFLSGRFCDTFEVIAWSETNLYIVRLLFQTFSLDLFDFYF